MSCVYLLCADHPLPLYESHARRRYTYRGNSYDEEGFAVREHAYYRAAADELGFSMKPWRRELNLRATDQDADLLRRYLRANCAPGEQVELWRLWVGDAGGRAFHLAGPLADLDTDTLRQLDERDQTCITLTI